MVFNGGDTIKRAKVAICCLVVTFSILSSTFLSAADTWKTDPWGNRYLEWDNNLYVIVVNVNPGSVLNVRSGQGTGYTKVGSLPGGSGLYINGRNTQGDWYHVGSPVNGWVYWEYVSPID